MGAFQGSISYRKYYLAEGLPAPWQPAIRRHLDRTVFQPIDVESDDDRAIGWCSPRFPLRLDLLDSEIFYDEYVILGVRIDSLTLPASQVRIYAKAEEDRLLAERDRARLSRTERLAIREKVTRDLRRRSLPVIRHIEMVWNVPRRRVRFFNLSKRNNEDFADLFEETFGLQLVPESAYTAAAYGMSDLDPAVTAALAGLRASEPLGGEVEE